MKPTPLLRFLICAAIPLLIQTGFSASWQIVDDYQYVLGKDSFARGLAKDQAGNLFAAGAGVDSAGTFHAVAMKSTDDGSTWSTVDDYYNPAATVTLGPDYEAGICVDSAGRLYAAGTDWLPNNMKSWFVRRSIDGGLTWTTVDAFTLGGTEALPRSLEADSAGNVYVAGTASTVGTSTTNFAIVRKGVTDATGAMSWSTVDQVSGAFRLDETAIRSLPLVYGNGLLTCHPTAGIFVSGRRLVLDKTGNLVNQWIVRRSSDNGLTWTTSDAYQFDPNLGATAVGIGRDSLGNIYAVGAATQRLKGKDLVHWIVRKSGNGGASWATVDDYLPASGNSGAYRFAADSNGNLFVIGAGDLTRKSLGGVGAWTTIVSPLSGPFLYLSGLMGDNAGNMFSAGFQTDATGARHWLVRKLVP